MLLNEKALLGSFQNYPLISLTCFWSLYFKETLENTEINVEIKNGTIIFSVLLGQNVCILGDQTMKWHSSWHFVISEPARNITRGSAADSILEGLVGDDYLIDMSGWLMNFFVLAEIRFLVSITSDDQSGTLYD